MGRLHPFACMSGPLSCPVTVVCGWLLQAATEGVDPDADIAAHDADEAWVQPQVQAWAGLDIGCVDMSTFHCKM